MNAETQLSFGTMQGGQGMARPQEIERLVVALIARAGCTGALVAGPGIVLDVTVQGVRCLLIRADGPPAIALLSPREHEIARMVAKGLTNKSIAHVLDISPWTVSTHLRRIFTKLSVTSRAAMVAQLVLQSLPHDPGTVLCETVASSSTAATPDRSVGSRMDRHATAMTSSHRR